MELYLDLFSQPCRTVFMFAKAVGIPFEFKRVDLITGQQYGEEFGKVSMVRKLPVLKDGDFVLTESIAILKYMAQKHSSSLPDHWYPAELKQQARANEYMAWQHTNLRMHGSKIFMLRALYSPIMGCEVPKEKMDAALEELNQSLKLLEEKFLQDKPFIVGDKISVADLVALEEIMQPVGTGLDVFQSRPKLAAWRDRVKQVVGENLFAETHNLVMKASTVLQTLEPEKAQMFRPIMMRYFH